MFQYKINFSVNIITNCFKSEGKVFYRDSDFFILLIWWTKQIHMNSALKNDSRMAFWIKIIFDYLIMILYSNCIFIFF